MIIIAGDSWGEGRWVDTSTGDGPRWPGFHHYWIHDKLDHAVNVSFGGYSNHQAVSALDMFLAHKYSWPSANVIIWLTCVLRDFPVNYEVDNIDTWVQRHYENIFDRLVMIAQRHSVQVSILGGLGDIPRHFPSRLSSNVSIMLHSTSKFLNPEYNFELPYGHITLLENIPAGTNRLKVFADLEKKFDYMQSRKDIYPDGGHFVQQSYQKIYDYAKTKI
jgi:hypothetical protein